MAVDLTRKNGRMTLKLPLQPSPALMEHARERAQSFENRIADRITDFAGSMRFVYLHILWFGLWIGLGAERYPYGLLTMIVSLEAIFLSTFVMISQNRADSKRQVIADAQWQTVQEEDKQNQQLLDLSNQILALTREVHAYAASRSDGADPSTDDTPRPASRRSMMERAPILICYDGSDDARRAIAVAAELLSSRPAVVLDVTPPLTAEESEAALFSPIDSGHHRGASPRRAQDRTAWRGRGARRAGSKQSSGSKSRPRPGRESSTSRTRSAPRSSSWGRGASAARASCSKAASRTTWRGARVGPCSSSRPRTGRVTP